MLSTISDPRSNAQQASLLEMLHGLNKDELTFVMQASKDELVRRQQKVKDVYGQWFSDGIGLDLLYNLPRVPSGMNFVEGADCTYPPPVAFRPSHWANDSAVRGVMGNEFPRPFIAIKTEVLDPNTRKVVYVAVELIFKRYSLNGDGAKGALYENNYVTTLDIGSTTGQIHRSNLYSSGGMSNDQLKAIKELLKGDTIKAPIGDMLIRMAR